MDRLLNLVNAYPGYAWMTGRILRTIWGHFGNLNSNQRTRLRVLVLQAIDQKGIRTDCQLQGIAQVLAVELTKRRASIKQWASDAKGSWWGIVYFILNVRAARYGEIAFTYLLYELLTHPNQEVCRAAAYRLCLLGHLMPNQAMDVRGECRALFSKHGLATRAQDGGSQINYLLRELCMDLRLGIGWFKPVDWHMLLGSEHDGVLKYIVRLHAEHRTSRDKFILCLDSALETVFDAIWISRGYLDFDTDGKKLKNSTRGCRMRTSRTAFSVAYPDMKKFFVAVNDLRNRSEVAHRKNTHAGTLNQPVTYTDVNRAMKLARPALTELAKLHPQK